MCVTVLCRTGTEGTIRAAQTHQRRGSRSHGDSIGSHPRGRREHPETAASPADAEVRS